MIPDANRKEWVKLINGETQYKFSSFALQMQVNKLSWEYKNRKIPVPEAVEELRKLCIKYERLVQKDLQAIFGGAE